jgi:hypothetical protein
LMSGRGGPERSLSANEAESATRIPARHLQDPIFCSPNRRIWNPTRTYRQQKPLGQELKPPASRIFRADSTTESDGFNEWSRRFCG